MQASVQNPREGETPRANPRAGVGVPSASASAIAPTLPAMNRATSLTTSRAHATGASATASGAFQWSEPRGDAQGAALVADAQSRASYPAASYPAASYPAGYGSGYGPQVGYSIPNAQGMGRASLLAPGAMPYAAPTPDPDVWLIALPLTGGSYRALEGAGRSGAIRVSRPYGHLRAIRPVFPSGDLGAPLHRGGFSGLLTADQPRRGRGTGAGASRRVRGALGSGALGKRLPAERPAPQVIMAVEIESDAGMFRVERPDSVLGHNDLAWALAHMEAGEPDSVVPLPRRYLALLLTLLPTPEDPEHPEADRNWGWAHRLRGPWERGPLHPHGKLGRLIAVDPDDTGQGMHRACFEMLGSDEVVWALGVPCFRTGSVYELTPLGKSSLSRWLNWPLNKARRRAGMAERPDWEIARVVYRVGAPRWPLAGVVEPLGPMGVAG